MRHIIVSNIMTLDGYYSGPGGDLSSFQRNEAFDRHNLDLLQSADTVLLGRETYTGFRPHWPREEHNPATTPTLREYAKMINPMRKVVISDSLTVDDTTGWGETEIVRRADRLDRIADLKRQPGGNMVVFGSRTMWHDLFAHGLVDELHVMIDPIALGAGIPLFDSLPYGVLRVQVVQTWDGAGCVQVRYAVEPPAAE